MGLFIDGMNKFQKKTHRAREALVALGQQYQIWSDADQLRQSKDEMGWPDWCYLPMGGWHAIAMQHASSPLAISQLTAKFAALGTWRMTQGIYRFDPALYPALIETPVSGDIPEDVLYQLPEWCVYIETHDLLFEGHAVYGFWCHLEYDFNTGRHELRFLADTDAGVIPAILHLKGGSLLDALDASLAESSAQAARLGLELELDSDKTKADLLEFLPSALSLVLYLCSQQEFTRRGVSDTPKNPEAKKTKKGWKLFSAAGPAEWDVGVRIGAALRKAYHAEETGKDSAPTGRQVRPHVRRAHWHTFVSGPRIAKDGSDIPADKRKRNLKWVPPIAVNVDSTEGMPSVIRKVD